MFTFPKLGWGLLDVSVFTFFVSKVVSVERAKKKMMLERDEAIKERNKAWRERDTAKKDLDLARRELENLKKESQERKKLYVFV